VGVEVGYMLGNLKNLEFCSGLGNLSRQKAPQKQPVNVKDSVLQFASLFHKKIRDNVQLCQKASIYGENVTSDAIYDTACRSSVSLDASHDSHK